MTNWNDGYVSDISYSGAVYREQMPAHLDVACLMGGVAPPVEPGEPFSYCELGCGLGDTAIAVAAGNPRARVWGFDFNPAHVATGRTVATRTGLTNCTIAESSFEELAASPPGDLPLFDYVTLHGVWSWISAANQGHIVAFLRRHLRPGGIASVSYNTLPGWAGQAGLQRLLFEAGRATGGGSDRGIREAMGLARRMADAGCGAVDSKWLERMEVLLKDGQTPYLSHEYLNAHWRPAFHGEVAEAMAGAKLTYAASATMFDNFQQFCLRPDQGALVATLTPELRRTAEDAFCGRMFRRDIFVRGPRPLSSHTLTRRIGAQRLVLVVPPRSTTLKIKIPVGEATLSESFYGPALAALGRGDTSVADLHTAAAPGTAPVLNEVLGMLVGSGQVLPAPNEPDEAALAAIRRFNRMRVALYTEEVQQKGWLVGARTGAAVSVGLDEMLVYEVVAEAEERGVRLDEGEAVSDAVRRLMATRGMGLRPDVPEGVPDVDADIREILAERVPVWRAVGAL